MSNEINKMKDELMRIQTEMYSLGKVDSLKAIKRCFENVDDSLFSKVFVVSMIDSALTSLNQSGVNNE